MKKTPPQSGMKTPETSQAGYTGRPSRPRLYVNEAEKFEAFRIKQNELGYLRKEVVMTTAVVQRVEALAVQLELPTTDVASALLELGLTNYGNMNSTDDPILSFAARRKRIMKAK